MIDRERLVLIGYPVSQSLSGVMHDAALEAAGVALRYEKLEVEPDSLERVMNELAGSNCAGNITMPYKKTVMRSMRECSGVAQRAGAVNTFWSDGQSGLLADNTDVAGFSAAISELVGDVPADVRVAVLGSGGAAGAVITAIEAWPGATASVHARDLARAMSMRMRHSAVVRVCSMRDPCISDAHIVINATPIGMSGEDFPTELERLAPGAIVVDLVYRANETAWVRAARERGHTATDGLRMLYHQGVESFQHWFGETPDRAVMWTALSTATGRSH